MPESAPVVHPALIASWNFRRILGERDRRSGTGAEICGVLHGGRVASDSVSIVVSEFLAFASSSFRLPVSPSGEFLWVSVVDFPTLDVSGFGGCDRSETRTQPGRNPNARRTPRRTDGMPGAEPDQTRPNRPPWQDRQQDRQGEDR